MLPEATDTTPDAQHFAADQLNALGNLVDFYRLGMIADIDRTESWRADGAPSIEQWVAFRWGKSWDVAAIDVKLARSLEGLPKIAEAYCEGLLSREKITDLVSFVEPHEDERWAEEAQGYTASYVKRCARFVKRMRRENAGEIDKKRTLHLQWDLVHDVLRINGVLPGADGALFKNAIDGLATKADKAPDGTWPGLSERRADGLVTLAAANVDQQTGNARATVVVHVGAKDLNAVHGIASLEDGPPVPSEVARRLGCDGYLQAVLHAEDGTVIGIGRRSRVVPRALEQEVRERDRGCVCCGSDLMVGSEIHHVIPWARGGRTDLDNLVLVCKRCHRLIHDRGYNLRRGANGLYRLSAPNGRPITNRPAKLRSDIRERFVGPSNRRPTAVPVRC